MTEKRIKKQTPADFKTTASIETRYHVPTNTRGARVSARRGDHRTGEPVVWLCWDHALDDVQNHAAAALKLQKKAGIEYPLFQYATGTARGYLFLLRWWK